MPRLPEVARENLQGEELATYDRMLEGFNSRPGYPRHTQVGGLYGLLMHNPELAARVSAVGDHILRDGDIDFLDKEIVCLTVARQTTCQLEWAVHLPMSRAAGVREEAIQAIAAKRYGELLPREQLMANYAVEVLDDRVSDETWLQIADLMGQRGAVNLTLLVTFTALICHCMDAFGLEPPPGTEPLLPVP